MLSLGDAPATRKLTSDSLNMAIEGVTSAHATNLTDGLWEANTGMPDDKVPEVPPDGEQRGGASRGFQASRL